MEGMPRVRSRAAAVGSMHPDRIFPPFRPCLLLGAFAVLLFAPFARGGFWGFEGSRAQWFGTVWEASLPDFGDRGYGRAVEALIARFEAETGERLMPGELNRVGLKVYTNSGAGLYTPHPLTRGVIDALVRRGFAKDRLLIVDASAGWLRESGYLPPLSARDQPREFHGVPVVAVDSGELFDEKWYYESPVPPEFTSFFARQILGPEIDLDDPDRRKSRLPATLLTQVDFWINLPMVTDHPSLGINGSLVNATLWNVGNRQRFFTSPANSPVAVAEIAAIPELQDTWALTLVTLERYQFVGGPNFNSLYTHSEPRLWLSADPVMLDALMLERLNHHRRIREFDSLGVLIPQLDYSVDLGLGYGLPEQATIVPLDGP
jgi:hypothetical protein